MELPEESGKTTKLVTAADGDNNRSKLSPNGKTIFLNTTSLFVNKSYDQEKKLVQIELENQWRE